MISGLRSIDYRLWAAIFLTALLPTLYATTRIYFLNSLPDTGSLNIAAQSAWLHLAYEVLQEALLLPLYFVFGQVLGDLPALRRRVTTAFAVSFAAYAALTLLVLLGAGRLVSAMAQQPELREATVRYLRLESLAIALNTLNEICVIVVIVCAWGRLLLALLALRCILMILFDSLFVGQFFSLDLGVVGVAWTNIAVGLLMLCPSLWILARRRLLGGSSAEGGEPWARRWLGAAWRSGLKSAIRNLAFSLMILRLMNEIQESGLFWVANGFIWGWLLLPILTLGALMRRDAGTHGGVLGDRFLGYLGLVGLIVMLWILTIPGWTWFVATAMGAGNAERVVDLTLLMLIFYVVFAFNSIFDSYLYGVGRMDLLLRQSVAVNVFYYGAAFIAYEAGWFIPDLTRIALLFGGGMILDWIVTLRQFRRAGYPLGMEKTIEEGSSMAPSALR